MKTSQSPKVLIFGIDGGTWDIILPLIHEGELPHLKEMLKAGASGVLHSSFPPVTATAWASFMTGVNPGKHGFFDFKRYDIKRYNYSFIREPMSNSRALPGRTLWDHLSRHGLRVCVIGLPMTYPAWEVNGYMMSGFPAPKVSLFPKSWTPPDAERCLIPPMAQLSQSEKRDFCYELVESQTDIFLNALKHGEFHLYAIVYNSTDIAQHYFWKEMNDPYSPFRTTIFEVYKRIDQALGQLRKNFLEDMYTIILSDHGFGPTYTRFFNLNAYLEHLGVLKRKERPKEELECSTPRSIKELQLWLNNKRKKYQKQREQRHIKRIKPHINLLSIDLQRSQAYGFNLKPPLVGVVINLKGRQKYGTVSPGEEYEQLRSFLIEKLRCLEDEETGKTVVKDVSRREDFYHGPYVEQIPDLILILNAHYKPTAKLSKVFFEVNPNPFPFDYSGLHRPEGIILIDGPGVKRNFKMGQHNIVDIFPTVTWLYNVPNPSDLDGTVIPAFEIQPSVSRRPPALSPEISAETHTPAEEKRINDILKGLGYMD